MLSSTPRVLYVFNVFDNSGHRFEAVHPHEGLNIILDSKAEAEQYMRVGLMPSYIKKLLAEADFWCIACLHSATALKHQAIASVWGTEHTEIRAQPAPICGTPSCSETVT